ncbi:MAG: helix-turn-helix transcriptional regulator [SAR202 cluster bacterium]|jgi:ArsR family transcriptional regulator|nr:helix-turn-helix transcriptional regulator [SAR202 cluster bacterium]HAL47926.1 ArsR family transcriptional regulator [Dehalococcoidia bacterium]|tara:strand:+ start:1072 stop:1431 length:360 start_codon:yes stop_codon:yes gene_type:complete
MSNYRNNDPTRFAEMFAALSNPNRLRIFLRLIDCCGSEAPASCTPDELTGACVGDLGRDMGIAPSTVSHHIKELQRAGLIETTRQGQKIECRIDPTKLTDLAGFFTGQVDPRILAGDSA